MELEVKLEVFEGPLDLLLHLIEKNKVDIYDIPIVEITRQYLEYVSKLAEENLDLASEFLVMASTLIDIKCKMLLPKEVDEDGEEIDPRTDLVQKLIEYEMEEVSLTDKITYVKKVAVKKHKCSFKQLLENQTSKMEVIVTFLAVLELIKVGEINVSQEKTFDDIIISTKE